MPDPINIADEYEKRDREKLNARLALMRPLPVDQQSLINKLLASAPYLILKFGPDAITKAEKFLRDNDITFPLMGTVFKMLRWGFNFVRGRCRIS